MKVAVTVWDNRISPVFDASSRLLIAEIENNRVTKQSVVIFDPKLPSNLTLTLARLDVPVLICGAVSQVPATIIAANGITLIPFIAGEVDRVLEVYAKGNSLVPIFTMPGCLDCIPKNDATEYSKRKEQPLTQLLFVTSNNSTFGDLSAEIEERGGLFHWATSGRQALETIGQTAVDLILADEILADMTGLELIERLITVNPMINSAVVSSLPKDVFHEASEGLGILMQLPPKPDRSDGKRLMTHLNQVIGLTTTTNK